MTHDHNGASRYDASMADERQRELERQAATGDAEAEAKLLVERARAGLGNGFSMLWPAWMLERLSEGEPLRVVFTGHNAGTRLPKAIKPGDRLMPLRVKKGRIHLLGAMTYERREPTDEYVAANPNVAGLNPYSCSAHAVIGTHAVPLRFDRPVPLPVVEAWQFVGSRGKVRPLKNKDGLIKNVTPLQGIYQLEPRTELALLSLLTG